MAKIKLPKISFFIIITLLVCLLIFLYSFFAQYYGIYTYSGEDVLINVEMGESVKSVAATLCDKGIISNKYVLVLKHKLNHDEYGDITYGKHLIENGMTLDEIIKSLTSRGETNFITVSIPEGYSAQMIASRLEKLGICKSDDFISSLENDTFDYEFIKHIPNGNYKYKLEGFLFPDTYNFSLDTSAHEVINTLLSNFETKYNENFSSYDGIFEIVTMASIVEREAVLDTERAKIAGVIKNRINKDMLLQVDATVVYAKSLGLYDMTSVSYDDLEVDSVYNTYKYKGLTPGPISNPGIKSIKASANPEKHDYLFYHTDETKKDGSHIFTKTYGEHMSTQR